MELKKITEEEYLNFSKNHENISIYQLPAWGKLKEATGWSYHLLGLYENNTLIGTTMLLEKKGPFNLNLFYSPRGYLFDTKNKALFNEFTRKIKEYLKKHHGFMLKIDPNIIYSLCDSEGSNRKLIGEDIYHNFKDNHYKHLGFTKDFETMQPRYLCRIPLYDTYENTFATFSKSTRKNIEKTEKMGVKTRVIDETEIDLFVSLLQDTANLKGFIIRPTSYYKRMYELMKDYIKLYIAYIDTNSYYEYLLSEKEIVTKNLANIEEQIKHDHVGNKLKTAIAQNNEKLERLNKELKEAEDLRHTSDEISIGALMSIFIGNEGITFMSGTSNIYKKFNPKYAFYTEHIKESIKEHKEYCNFYGISGNLDPTGPYYSIYELKKGFKPEIVELIGEFDLIISPFKYYLYQIALKCYKIIKKIRH